MKKIKIIIDTDPGVDDTTALVFSLFEPKLDIKLICTCSGNATLDQTTRNACHVMDLLEKDIPIAKGFPERLSKSQEYAHHMHGVEGLGNYIPPKTTKTKPIKKDCLDAIYEILKENPKQITYFVFGPHTNLANLFIKYPDSKNLIKEIVMMGGAPGGIKINPNYASFNIRTDIPAFAYTAQCGLPIVICPSKIGREVTHFTKEQVEFIKNSNDVGRFFELTYQTYWEPGYDEKVLSCCDLTTLYYVLNPKIFKTKKAYIKLNHQTGKLDAIYNRKGNFRIVENVNRKKFQKIIFKKMKEFDKIKLTNKTFLKNIKEAK